MTKQNERLPAFGDEEAVPDGDSDFAGEHSDTAVDREAARVIAAARQRDAAVVVLSEYGITAVSRPVDVNRASREVLLRVPGLGYKNVAKILSIRRYHRVTLEDLRKLRVPLRRVRPFVVTPAHSERLLRLDREDLPSLLVKPAQLELFSASLEATSGQL